MSELFQSARFWWPGILRALIIVVLAGATVFVAQLEKITTPDTGAWGWVEWAKFFGPIVVSMMIALKGFLDDTMQKLRSAHTELWKKGEPLV
jgi:hypothetical protein